MGKTRDLFKKIRDTKGNFMQRWANKGQKWYGPNRSTDTTVRLNTSNRDGLEPSSGLGLEMEEWMEVERQRTDALAQVTAAGSPGQARDGLAREEHGHACSGQVRALGPPGGRRLRPEGTA